jgi:orotate phosphoribosyltransferase
MIPSSAEEEDMAQENRYEKMLKGTGVIITDDHLVYKSGRHGSGYVDVKGLVPENWHEHTPETETLRELCRGLALSSFAHEDVHTVIGPATGGIALAQWTGHWLNHWGLHPVTAIHAYKTTDGKGFYLTPEDIAYHIQNKRVLVVEDVLTTGGSVRQVAELVHCYGGKVVAVSAVCNRGSVTERDLGDDVPFPKLTSLVNINLESWSPEDCPMCRDGVPVNTQYGHGKDFLARSTPF